MSPKNAEFENLIWKNSPHTMENPNPLKGTKLAQFFHPTFTAYTDSKNTVDLVGGFNPVTKYESNWTSFPQVGMKKMKNL